MKPAGAGFWNAILGASNLHSNSLRSACVTDTMLTSPDFLEDSERQHILNVAPAEGNRPLSTFRDKYCEELACPGIFLGQPWTENKHVYYSDICKSELRRSDRRAAMCVENIFIKQRSYK